MRLLEAQNYRDGTYVMLFRPEAEDTHMKALLYHDGTQTAYPGLFDGYDVEIVRDGKPDTTTH